MADKFGRHYKLTVINELGQSAVIQDPLTLDFSISKSIMLDMSANQGTMRIFNLAETTRQLIYKDAFRLDKYLRVVLEAGYAQLSVIFSGNITRAYSVKEEGSVNVITEITGFDGGYMLNNSFSSWTVAAGATKQSVIQKAAKDLVRGPNIQMEVGAMSQFDGVHVRGVSVGPKPTQEVLKTMTGNNFFVNDEKAYLLKPLDCTPDPIFIVSSETGLLGSPKRFDALTVVEVLFEPNIKMGQMVQLISSVNPRYNGIYKINGIEHQGTISGAVCGKCKTKLTMFENPGLKQVAAYGATILPAEASITISTPTQQEVHV